MESGVWTLQFWRGLVFDSLEGSMEGQSSIQDCCVVFDQRGPPRNTYVCSTTRTPVPLINKMKPDLLCTLYSIVIESSL